MGVCGCLGVSGLSRNIGAATKGELVSTFLSETKISFSCASAEGDGIGVVALRPAGVLTTSVNESRVV